MRKINSEGLETTRLENQFEDYKPALNETEATIEANRCINCYEAPCIQACPTQINIPQFIRRIAANNVRGAAKTILDSNILGLSCAVSCPTEVLCEGACVYHSLNKKPILIGRLQRYAVESYYSTDGSSFYSGGAPTGKRIALVGAGPASLACAHELRKKGHETVIFEKTMIAGGLNTQGIAPYKMRAHTSLLEIEKVAAIGIHFKFGQELGRDFQIKDLIDSYDAVFLGMGLGPDSHLSIPGAVHPRVRGAVEFIADIKMAPSQKMSWLDEVKTAVIVGGGNTALDACRELKKLGIPRVVVSYRRGEAEMSGYRHEFQAARQEGVEFLFYTLPQSFKSLDSHTLEVTLQRTEVTPEGKVALAEPLPPFESQLILAATGQSRLDSFLSEAKGKEKVFTGGDLLNGGKEVVNAVAEGKKAALRIHEMLLSKASVRRKSSSLEGGAHA